MNDYPPIPPDDLQRHITLAQPDKDQNLPHIGIVGDTYTILFTGDDTNGRFGLIDMRIPSGGGPPPHRHDFEETFMMLEGELDVTFRSKKSTVHAGDTVNIPSNAPHQFHNGSGQPVRLLCLCSPSGLENFFQEVGVAVATRATAPPKLSAEARAEFKAKSFALSPRYRIELLEHA
jgi:mannose-6-phosphate isomerase-like protein (cupin superfamily)